MIKAKLGQALIITFHPLKLKIWFKRAEFINRVHVSVLVKVKEIMNTNSFLKNNGKM
jgi:hypothetical protein